MNAEMSSYISVPRPCSKPLSTHAARWHSDHRLSYCDNRWKFSWHTSFSYQIVQEGVRWLTRVLSGVSPLWVMARNVTVTLAACGETLTTFCTFIRLDPDMHTRADSRFASSKWETVLLGNDVSHWLGASLESACIRRCVSRLLLHVIMDEKYAYQGRLFGGNSYDTLGSWTSASSVSTLSSSVWSLASSASTLTSSAG